MDKIYSSIKRSLNEKKLNLALLFWGLLLLCVSAWLILVYFQYYQDRFYPKTFIDGVNVSGLKKDEAKAKIQANLQKETAINLAQDSLILFYQDKQIETKLSELAIQDNLTEVIEIAFADSQRNKGFGTINQYEVKLDFDQAKIKSQIENLKKQVDSTGKKPSLALKNKKVVIDAGITSNELLIDETWQALHKQILSKNLRDLRKEDLKVEAIVNHSIVALNQLQIAANHDRVAKLIDQNLFLNYEHQKITLTDQDLINFLALPEGFNQENLDLFIENLKQQVDRPSSNARLVYDKDTLQVTDFAADQDGLQVDADNTKIIIEDFLTKIEENASAAANVMLPMQSTKAAITLEQTNDLGIKELLGFGESWYAHSTANRIDNVALTASRISNHIIKPGEEFSFNKTLGEVSEKTGYKNAYIIEAGETKLAPGGGVCQVSSTLFRTLLDAGVKITRRLPHAYRVSYYEIGNEPGFDATVYAGNTDLRFINDTPGHLLLNCQTDSDKLYMFCQLYGTSDGRSTEIVNYKKWDLTPAPPTIYIPDASLKPGELKQIDWATSGIKTEFTNVIRDKNGNTIREDYYYSNYKPWAAKYLQGV